MRILANLNVVGTLDIDTVTNAGADTDRFLVQDANGVVRYRTGAEVASDIGAAVGFVSTVKHLVKLGENISKGQAVYVSGSNGTNMIVMKASNASESTSSKTFGLLETGGITNDEVYVVTEGLLAGLDTSTANAGDPVWLGAGGNLIFGLANKPYAPEHLVFIGIVTRVQQNNGEIFVKVQNGFELQELHNVQITTTPANNTVLSYETSSSLYKMKSIPTLLGYTPADDAGVVHLAGTETITGEKTFTAATTTFAKVVANSPSAGATGEGLIVGKSFKLDAGGTGEKAKIYVVSKDLSDTYGSGLQIQFANADDNKGFGFNLNTTGGFEIYTKDVSAAWVKALTINQSQNVIFNNTPLVGLISNWIVYHSGNLTIDTLSGVPSSRQLTINGTAYDLSANRSWSVGTVTSVAALTIGTTGTDITSTVATGTTTPVITLNIPTASATNRGALSSTDWSTFNNKVSSTRTLTINGTSYDLSADRTWNVGTVTGSGTANQLAYWNGSSSVAGSTFLTLNLTADNGYLILTGGSTFKNADIWLNRLSDAWENAIRFQTNGTTDWYLGSSATGSNSNLEFFSYGTSSAALTLLRSNANANFGGSVGINNTSLTGYSLRVSRTMVGDTASGITSFGIVSDGTVQSDVTSGAFGFNSSLSTAAAAFTLDALIHFRATQGTIGNTSSVTNQYGFAALGTMTGATNNYGFFGSLDSATGRWNLYMSGTARNYLNGDTSIGTTTGGYKLNVSGTSNFSGALTGTVGTFSDTLTGTGLRSFAVNTAQTPSNNAGWYTLARFNTYAPFLNTNGNSGIITLSFYGGGLYTPSRYRIFYFKDDANVATLKLEKYGAVDYIQEVRIRYRTGDTRYYIEIYCDSHASGLTFDVHHDRLFGYGDQLEIFGGVLSAANAVGTILASLPFVDHGTTMSSLNVVTSASFSSSLTANSFVKSGGIASQFLKADGTVDSTTYQPALTNPVTGTGAANQIAYWTSSSEIGTLSTATYPSLTELSYVKGVTSGIQAQLDAKQVAFGNQTANTVYAGPSTGSAAAPTFRSLVVADLPSHTHAWSQITSTPTTISGYGITDAYTKTEVDSFLQGLDPKASVKVATTGPITLSGTQTIDGIAVVAGDRVLVKDQSPQTTNGIYVVSSSGWSRASDMDAASEFPGAYVFVEQGTANADKGFVCTNDSVNLGSTAIIFVQFSGSGAYQAVLNGTGFVRMAGTTVSYVTGTASEIIAADGSKITAGTNITISGGTISSTSVGFANPMTTLGDIIYGGASGVATRLAGNTTATKQYLSQTGNGTASAAPSWATIAGSDITGAALTETDDTNVTLTLGGSPSTALLRAVSLTLGWTGQLAVSRGGTGASSFGSNEIIYGNSASALQSSSQFTFSPTGVFFINNTISAGGIAMNLTSTVNAAANNSILYGVRISPTFNNGAFTGITQRALGVFGDVYINGTITGAGWGGSTITVDKGGTGLTALGTAGQLIRVNSGATALEYFTPTYLTSYTETDTLSSVTGRGATTSTQITLSGKLRMSSDLGVDAGSTIFFGREENFGGTDTGGTDYGYITFDNNNTTYGGTGGTERSVLRIGTQNDAPGTTEDNIALEPAADLYLNPGGGIYRGNKTTRYTIWDSGNLTNLNQLTNGPGYITSSANISGASSALSSSDNRTIAPNEDNAAQLKFGFTSWNNNNASGWADYLHLRSYTDSTGGSDNLIMFSRNGFGMRQWQQTFGSATAYSSYVDYLHSGNYTDYTVTKTGGGASGFWGISIDGTVSRTVPVDTEHNFLYGIIGTNDYFRVRAGGGSNAGWLEIATADDGTEPIYVRQYTGVFATLTRTLTLLDGSGNTSIPGSLTIGGNTAIHAGNIGSQSVNYANYSGYSRRIISEYQEWDFGTGSHSTNPMSISIYDNYAQAGAPSTYGTLVDIYGLSGHQHDQLYFAQGSLKHRYGWYGNNNWSGWNEIITASNISSYAAAFSGGWYGFNVPGSRYGGFAVNGGEIVFGRDLPNNGQMGMLVDGAYLAGENNGFWSLPSDNNWNGRRGMYWDGSQLNFTTNSPVGRFSGLMVDCGAATGRGGYAPGTLNIILNSSSSGSDGVCGIDFRSGNNYPSDGASIYFENSQTGSGEVARLVIRVENDTNDSILMRAGYHVYNATTVDIGGQGYTNPIFLWQAQGNNRMELNSSGNLVCSGDVTAYGSPSDIRLKTIKETIQNPIEKIKKISGYRFDWNEVNDILKIKEDVGVIAQEIAEVLPELARTNENGFMSVRYQGLTALLIEAIKEQQNQIEELKSQIKNK